MPQSPFTSRRSSRSIAMMLATALTAGVLATTLIGGGGEASAAEAIRDGSTQEQAAASCFAAKEENAAATDGVYWLQTPSLIQPQEFYCDMTTDGGGWVLVGRGRDGWTFRSNGQGNQSAMAANPDGTDAFSPTAYSSELINDLLDGQRVDELTDGVRIRRSLNENGTGFQELRWFFRQPDAEFSGRDRWTWSFGAGLELSSVKIDGVTYGETNTLDSYSKLPGGEGRITPTDERRWYTPQSTSSKAGFQYRSSVPYSTSSTSYIWGTSSSYRFPFAQVFVRPRISNDDLVWSQIPATGTPETTKSTLLDSKPHPMEYGVAVNDDPNDQYPALNSLVMGIAEIGDTIYIGGEFQKVERGSDLQQYSQPYLAAFDKITGAWRTDFDPVVDGTVFDVRATPDGKLLVGGSFSNINGVANTRGLALLDPTTGAVDPSWRTTLTRNGSSLRPLVRTMQIKGDWLYVGGAFNEVRGGVPLTASFGVGNLVRVSLANGTPDPSWRPVVDSSPYHLSPSPVDNTIWLSGWFENINGTPANSVGAVSTVGIGDRVGPAGMQNWVQAQTPSPTQWDYQYVIQEYLGKVWQAGSQHNVAKYDKGDYAFEGASITRTGGDFQAMLGKDGIIYAGCHCTDYIYEGEWWYTLDVDHYQQAESIRSFGAWDAETNTYIAEFQPQLSTSVGEGPWEMFNDSDECMWVGGDFDQGGWNGNGYDYLHGFAKFCNRDTVAPSVPQNVAINDVNGRPRLTWSASNDNGGQSTKYEILRDDRVIASTWSTNYTDPTGTESANYFVRAVDRTDNRSASTGAVPWFVAGENVVLVADGSSWRYLANGSDQGTQWRQPAFDNTNWSAGNAPLGTGAQGIATDTGNAGVTQYFSHDFVVGDVSQLGTLELNLKRDDGAVVFINGAEVARTNVPFGELAFDRPAYAAQNAAPTTQTFNLPVDDLVTGQNRISIELHQADPAGGDAFLAANLVGIAKTGDSQAPTTSTVTTADVVDNAIRVNYTASGDNVGIALYRIERDGETITYRNGTSSRTYRDQQLTAGTTYEYSVYAIDANGNESPVGSASATTTGVAPGVNDVFIEAGDTWKYLANGSDQGTAWRQPSFNVASWATGAAPLGTGALGPATDVGAAGVTSYFSHDFTVADASAFGSLELRVRRDDGMVAYLNGEVIARSNVGFGELAFDQPAYSEENTVPGWRSWTVPTDDLVDGVNRLSIELHQADPNGGDSFLDADLTGVAKTNDAQAPTAPTLTTSGVNDSSVVLNWTESIDDDRIGSYRIQRDGQTVTYRNGSASRTYRDQQLTAGTTYSYSIVAIDPSGNESATVTVPVTTTGQAPVFDQNFVLEGAAWSYLADGTDQGDAWRDPGFVNAAWPSGQGPLGNGALGQATDVGSIGTTKYFATDFLVADSATVGSLVLRLRVDDGAVAYLNGQEIGRTNLPFGPPAASTHAYSPQNNAPGWSTFLLPKDYLVSGANRLAVEIHQADPSGNDAFMAATLTGIAASGDTEVPSTSTPTTADITRSAVRVNWSASTDNVGVVAYRVQRDGQTVYFRNATSSLTFRDQQLSAGTTFTYTVVAIDAAGNESVAGSVVASTLP